MQANLPLTDLPQSNPTQVDVSILIVTWNVWDLLRACLHSIERASRDLGAPSDIRAFGPATAGKQAPTLEVIVVDNASSDATVDLLPKRFPWVRLIRSATNLGFTAGNNVGYAASRGRTLYFLNPDTEFANSLHESGSTSDDSLWTLYQFLMEEPKVGLIGPQLLNADNSIQSSRNRFPNPIHFFFEFRGLGRFWQRNPWTRRLHMDDVPPTFRQELDWLVGAAMLARRSALEEIRQPGVAGPFDEGFFMYSEETDLCKRLKLAGWHIVYAPEAAVVHYQGRSSSQVSTQRDIYFHTSQIRYTEKYHGALWAKALRSVILWDFCYSVLIETGKWLLGHKRELRAKRIASYRQVLASKFRYTQDVPSSHTK